MYCFRTTKHVIHRQFMRQTSCWGILTDITMTMKTTINVEKWTNILTVSIKLINGILNLECDRSLNWWSYGSNVPIISFPSPWLAGLGRVGTNHDPGAPAPPESSQWWGRDPRPALLLQWTFEWISTIYCKNRAFICVRSTKLYSFVKEIRKISISSVISGVEQC